MEKRKTVKKPLKAKTAPSRKKTSVVSTQDKIYSRESIRRMNRPTLLRICKAYNLGKTCSTMTSIQLRDHILAKQNAGYINSPKKISIVYEKEFENLQLIPYYTSSELASFNKPALLKLCKSAGIKRVSETASAERLRNVLLEDQKKKSETSTFAIFDLNHVKQKAREMGLSTTGSKQDIADRIHRAMGILK